MSTTMPFQSVANAVAAVPLSTAGVPGPAITTTARLVPPTLLPTDPALLVQFLRCHHLSTLQQLYTTQLLAHQNQLSLSSRPPHASSSSSSNLRTKNRQSSSSTSQAGVNSSNKRRRASSLSREEEEERQQVVEEEEIYWESRRSTFNRGQPVDEAHIYELGYILEPEGAADIYYHGKHEVPPKQITRALLAETRLLFDPKRVDNTVVYSSALPLFAQSMNPAAAATATLAGDATVARTKQVDVLEAMSDAMKATVPTPLTTEEWERESIARFSNSCDGRIASKIGNRNTGDRVTAAATSTDRINGSVGGSGNSLAQERVLDQARLAAGAPIGGGGGSMGMQQSSQYQANQQYWR